MLIRTFIPVMILKNKTSDLQLVNRTRGGVTADSYRLYVCVCRRSSGFERRHHSFSIIQLPLYHLSRRPCFPPANRLSSPINITPPLLQSSSLLIRVAPHPDAVKAMSACKCGSEGSAPLGKTKRSGCRGQSAMKCRGAAGGTARGRREE